MNDGIATGLAALAMTCILKRLPWTTGLPRAYGPCNDVYFEASPMDNGIATPRTGLAMTCI